MLQVISIFVFNLYKGMHNFCRSGGMENVNYKKWCDVILPYPWGHHNSTIGLMGDGVAERTTASVLIPATGGIDL